MAQNAAISAVPKISQAHYCEASGSVCTQTNRHKTPDAAPWVKATVRGVSAETAPIFHKNERILHFSNSHITKEESRSATDAHLRQDGISGLEQVRCQTLRLLIIFAGNACNLLTLSNDIGSLSSTRLMRENWVLSDETRETLFKNTALFDGIGRLDPRKPTGLNYQTKTQNLGKISPSINMQLHYKRQN